MNPTPRPTPIDTLIIVCCHAIYLNGPSRDETNWLIERFQTGETPTFTNHIRQGIAHLRQNSNAILVFSGGATKRKQIRNLKAQGLISQDINEDRTEAESYHDVALQGRLFGDAQSQDLLRRTFQERWATDSYQNVLLALLQYPIWVRTYRSSFDDRVQDKVRVQLPRKLVIVSHEFKRARFVNLHVPAILSLLEHVAGREMRVDFIGLNPPFDEEKMKSIEEGDRKRGFGVWKDDLHGTGDLLERKRMDRGWDEEAFLNQLASWYDDASMRQIRGIVKGITT